MAASNRAVSFESFRFSEVLSFSFSWLSILCCNRIGWSFFILTTLSACWGAVKAAAEPESEDAG